MDTLRVSYKIQERECVIEYWIEVPSGCTVKEIIGRIQSQPSSAGVLFIDCSYNAGKSILKNIFVLEI